MARTTTRLTDKEVKAAKPKEKEYTLSDGDGLRFRVKKNGSKLWLLNYTHPTKKRREHRIPLTEQAIALLETMMPISQHREFVFPSDRDPKKPCNSQTANMALKRMGFAGRLVNHSLRSLASTTLNEQGFEADLIEAALAHVDDNQVRSAYNRTDYLERRIPVMIWWSRQHRRGCTRQSFCDWDEAVKSNLVYRFHSPP